jgi:hypothetical protein
MPHFEPLRPVSFSLLPPKGTISVEMIALAYSDGFVIRTPRRRAGCGTINQVRAKRIEALGIAKAAINWSIHGSARTVSGVAGIWRGGDDEVRLRRAPPVRRVPATVCFLFDGKHSAPEWGDWSSGRHFQPCRRPPKFVVPLPFGRRLRAVWGVNPVSYGNLRDKLTITGMPAFGRARPSNRQRK